MTFFISGVICLCAFYLIVFVVALCARKSMRNSSEEEMILAGRRLGVIIGTVTLTATFIGPATWTGSAEIIYSKGLIWSQTSYLFIIVLILGIFLISDALRKSHAVTIIDLFQRDYGQMFGAFYTIFLVSTDIVILSAGLNSLGSSLEPILHISHTASIISSTIFVGIYTSIGSMYAVVYTDVVQLILMTFGIIVAIPFVCTHEAVDTSRITTKSLIGTIEDKYIPHWIDMGCSIVFGALVVQPYLQRILAIKTDKLAKLMSIYTAVLVAALSLPAVILAIYARITDWEAVPTFNRTILPADTANILSITLLHLTPKWVSIFALCALTAASMSTADSIILSSSSCIVRNIYKNILRTQAGEKEIVWVMRISNLSIPIIAMIISLTAPTIYDLLILGADLKFSILFPHFMIVLYWKKEKNAYGVLFSLIIGTVLRLLGGLPLLRIPVIIQYPGFDAATGKQLFPHRILTMLVVAVSHIVFSCCAKIGFRRKIFSEKYDFLKVFSTNPEQSVPFAGENHGDHLLSKLIRRDIQYLIFFPHVMTLLFWKGELNSYGALASLIIGVPYHVAGGIPTFRIPALIKYPGYNPGRGQSFPYRTFGMIVLATIHLSVSWLSKFLFSNGFLGRQCDILTVFPESSEVAVPAPEQDSLTDPKQTDGHCS